MSSLRKWKDRQRRRAKSKLRKMQPPTWLKQTLKRGDQDISAMAAIPEMNSVMMKENFERKSMAET
eukprot:CAMPEP_0113537146 /NCGR_PEP_ID=MMETSP0015_2-20120614/6665_1 /TAXON_ID=2838 /ORGANISM="Odontella" /LENGTH=65 /DNA_ID=CAMNT_0000436611 /DNA_START=89 /DNA_END=286 /DNA_ORIENTATION=- /assembly_acc=CAM_ASM_000160